MGQRPSSQMRWHSKRLLSREATPIIVEPFITLGPCGDQYNLVDHSSGCWQQRDLFSSLAHACRSHNTARPQTAPDVNIHVMTENHPPLLHAVVGVMFSMRHVRFHDVVGVVFSRRRARICEPCARRSTRATCSSSTSTKRPRTVRSRSGLRRAVKSAWDRRRGAFLVWSPCECFGALCASMHVRAAIAPPALLLLWSPPSLRQSTDDVLASERGAFFLTTTCRRACAESSSLVASCALLTLEAGAPSPVACFPPRGRGQCGLRLGRRLREGRLRCCRRATGRRSCTRPTSAAERLGSRLRTRLSERRRTRPRPLSLSLLV